MTDYRSNNISKILYNYFPVILLFISVMNHFDLYPSLIEFAGFEIKNSKMALGYSILNNDIDLNIYKVNINQLNKNINNFSKKYLSFWGL